MTADVDEEGETELSPRPPWRKQQGAEKGKKSSVQEKTKYILYIYV
jgi:hypothetical protein